MLGTVCLIDDDAIYRLLMRKMIEGLNCTQTLLEFSDGSEAWDYIEQNQATPEKLPDLILLDLEMPFMNGWQFLTQFATLHYPKKIPVYIMSSSTSLEDQERAQTYSQVAGYLVKPITKNQLLAVIAEL